MNAGRDGLDRRFVLNCNEIERFLVAMQKKISIRGAFAGLLIYTFLPHICVLLSRPTLQNVSLKGYITGV